MRRARAPASSPSSTTSLMTAATKPTRSASSRRSNGRPRIARPMATPVPISRIEASRTSDADRQGRREHAGDGADRSAAVEAEIGRAEEERPNDDCRQSDQRHDVDDPVGRSVLGGLVGHRSRWYDVPGRPRSSNFPRAGLSPGQQKGKPGSAGVPAKVADRHARLSSPSPGDAPRGSSSVGRASAFQAECREFEPRLPLHIRPPCSEHESVAPSRHSGRSTPSIASTPLVVDRHPRRGVHRLWKSTGRSSNLIERLGLQPSSKR